MPDPLSGAALTKLATRIGVPALGVWAVAIAVFVVLPPTWAWLRWSAIVVPGVLTVALVGVLLWGYRHVRRAQDVQKIMRQIESAGDRTAALAELDQKLEKKHGTDVAALVAKAQILMQEDPKAALAVLEQIELKKQPRGMADEIRGQRALIHLMHGELPEARELADGIELAQQQDAKSRALLTAVVVEAWARTGQAARAADLLGTLDINDAEFEALRPQLLRAEAFVGAYTNQPKTMRRALRRLAAADVRLVAAFLMKKSHPLLQREAQKLLEQSGQVPRRMVVQRRV